MDKPDSHTTRGLTRSLLLAALPLSLLICLTYLLQPSFVSSTNNRTTDILLRLAPQKRPSGAVVIVDIDESSLARYGQWPWPRYRIAQLLRSIDDLGAASVGLDLIFAEPDRSAPELSSARLLAARSGAAPPPTVNDRYLAQALGKGPVVLGYEFLFGTGTKPQEQCPLHPPGIVWISRAAQSQELNDFYLAKGVVCNRRELSEAVQRSGFLNAVPDPDGLLRRVPLLIRYQERLYPSLDLAMLMQYLKSGQIDIVREAGGALKLEIGGKSIPVDKRGDMIVLFSRRPEPAERYCAADLLEGKLPSHRLKGKLVLIGSSAAGLEPFYRTPSKALSSHADVHAQVLDNMLTGQHVVRGDRSLLWEGIIGMLAALAACLAIAGMAIAPSAVGCAALLGGCWIGMRLLFQSTGYLLSPLLPTVVLVSNYAVLTIFKTWMFQLAARRRAEAALALLEKSEKLLVKKQHQLEEINQNLERRIAEAVADLREKDRIMILQGRQAAMGEMIGNIAHQWRQPLNTLGLVVQELKMTYGRKEFNEETLDDSVRKAMTLIWHMSQTIEDFSNYFKPDKQMRRFNVNDAVGKTLSLIEPSLKSLNIEIEVAAKRKLDIVGYENEYSQVLLNILLNCRDAFEEGAPAGRRLISIVIFEEEGRAVVTVADTAGGISPEILDKVFDPYFTTKGPDKGTGIGLYMAKAIIEKNMGGRLSVRNTDGGAEFRIAV